jgi:hypothetical protein
MYNFILNQWIMRRIDENKVLSYAPRWISADQANAIINTLQVAE